MYNMNNHRSHKYMQYKMSIRPRPRINTAADTSYTRPVSIDIRDQSSIANRVYAALYGYENVYIVEEGDNEVLGTGPLVYKYNTDGYSYNDFRDLEEYTYTITGEDISR